MNFERRIDEDSFISAMEKEGYVNVRFIEGRGYCGLRNFIFTLGLCYGLDDTGFYGRWCYPKDLAIFGVIAYSKWDGNGDPDGPWVKFKGYEGEYSNEEVN